MRAEVRNHIYVTLYHLERILSSIFVGASKYQFQYILECTATQKPAVTLTAHENRSKVPIAGVIK